MDSLNMFCVIVVTNNKCTCRLRTYFSFIDQFFCLSPYNALNFDHLFKTVNLSLSGHLAISGRGKFDYHAVSLRPKKIIQ